MSTPNPDAPRRDLAFREGTAGFSLTLKRNCSISPAALLLGVAFVAYARRAADYEKIELVRGREVAEAQRKALHEVDARRARVCLETGEGYGARVILRGAEKEPELGRHLDAVTRVALAAELEKRLRI